MGPEATVLLMQKVVDAVPARDDADHVPLLVDQNPQVPSRIARLIDGDGEDPGPVLVAMARRLQAAGAEALAMPCNTAHHYVAEISAAVDIPVLDMIALAAQEAAMLAQGADEVGVLCSPAVRRVGLFGDALARHGLRPLYPADDDAMLAAIRRIKAGEPTAPARATLRAASQELLNAGAAVQLVACTEFSLITSALPAEVTWVDTIDRLVAEIVSVSNGRRDPSFRAGAPRSSAEGSRPQIEQQGKEAKTC